MQAGSSSCLLDTNIVMDFLRAGSEIARKIEPADEVFIPAIVLGKLFFGSEDSQNPFEQFNLVEIFLAFVTQLNTIHSRELYLDCSLCEGAWYSSSNQRPSFQIKTGIGNCNLVSSPSRLVPSSKFHHPPHSHLPSNSPAP